MNARSIKGKSPEDIFDALRELKHEGFNATFAFVFITTIDNAPPLSDLFTKEGITIFGVSTSGKFSEQGLESDDIVAMCMDINPDHFRLVLKHYSIASPYESARQTGEIGKQAFKNPGFIISGADFRTPGEDLINGLMDAINKDVTIIGGIGGEETNFSGIVFTNNSSTSRGLVVLIINQDRISLNGIAVSGWKPMGTAKKITKSEGSWIFTIDGEPAMNVIKKFLGDEISSAREATGLVPLNGGYPLQIQRESGTPMMKPIILWNTDDQSVMIGGQVKDGESFRFSLPPDFDLIDTVVNSSKIIKEQSMPEADALLVFSCIGRLSTFGPMISTEIEGLAATWNKPMIGFFSLGEFGKVDDSQCEFHGTTVSWVALKEK